MLEAVRGFVAPYINVLFISTAISSISLLTLRAFDIDAYRARTKLLFLPLAGSLLLALWISPSCFAHYFSLQTIDPAHIICVNSNYAYLGKICVSWVGLISFSGSIALGGVSYYYGGITAQWIYSADEVDDEELGPLYGKIMGMADKAGILDPDVYLLESSIPRIFSYGGHGWPKIYISVGLMKVLDEGEVLAAIGHEIAHIKNNDTFLKSASLSLKVASLFNIVGFIVDSMLSRHPPLDERVKRLLELV